MLGLLALIYSCQIYAEVHPILFKDDTFLYSNVYFGMGLEEFKSKIGSNIFECKDSTNKKMADIGDIGCKVSFRFGGSGISEAVAIFKNNTLIVLAGRVNSDFYGSVISNLTSIYKDQPQSENRDEKKGLFSNKISNEYSVWSYPDYLMLVSKFDIPTYVENGTNFLLAVESANDNFINYVQIESKKKSNINIQPKVANIDIAKLHLLNNETQTNTGDRKMQPAVAANDSDAVQKNTNLVNAPPITQSTGPTVNLGQKDITIDSSQPTPNLTSDSNYNKKNGESVSSHVESTSNWDLKKENISNFDKEFSKLSANLKLKKDKYESSDEYKTRLDGLGINNQLKLFLNLKDQNTKYDPDTQIFNYSPFSSSNLFYENDYFDHSEVSDGIFNEYKQNAIFELSQSSSKVGSYVGSNAFGAKRTVRKFKDIQRAVAFPSNAEFVNSNSEEYSFNRKPNKSFAFIKSKIYKIGDKASGGNVGSLMLNIRISKTLMKKIGGELGLVYVGNLRMPFYLQSSNLITPEISSPVEINTTYRALYINPTEILVVLPKSNEILIRFKADDYQVNPKYTQEISL